MNWTTTIYIILGGGFFQGLFITFLLLTRKTANKKANRVLALVVFICTLNIIHPYLSLLSGSAQLFNDLILNEPAQFLIAPLVVLYIRSLLKPSVKIKIKELVHFFPFIIVIAFSISPLSKNLEQLTAFPLSSIIMWGILIIQGGFYLTYAIRTIKQYRKVIQDEYSNLYKVDLNWIKWLFHTFVVLYICFFIILLFMVHTTFFSPIRPILTLSFIVIVWILGYRGLTQKEIYNTNDEKTKAPESTGKYNRSSLTKEESKQLKKQLKHIMDSEKIFLNPELKFDDLVKKLNTSRNDLSYTLNQGLNKNFYMFVNEYRVDEVIRLMKDSSRKHQKILALAFDSGFNSKPSFNAVFKKITGKTPSAYRETYN